MAEELPRMTRKLARALWVWADQSGDDRTKRDARIYLTDGCGKAGAAYRLRLAAAERAQRRQLNLFGAA